REGMGRSRRQGIAEVGDQNAAVAQPLIRQSAGLHAGRQTVGDRQRRHDLVFAGLSLTAARTASEWVALRLQVLRTWARRAGGLGSKDRRTMGCIALAGFTHVGARAAESLIVI